MCHFLIEKILDLPMRFVGATSKGILGATYPGSGCHIPLGAAARMYRLRRLLRQTDKHSRQGHCVTRSGLHGRSEEYGSLEVTALTNQQAAEPALGRSLALMCGATRFEMRWTGEGRIPRRERHHRALVQKLRTLGLLLCLLFLR